MATTRQYPWTALYVDMSEAASGEVDAMSFGEAEWLAHVAACAETSGDHASLIIHNAGFEDELAARMRRLPN